VILVARWTKYRADRFNQQNLSATIAGLEKLGLKVSLLRQVPEPTDDVPRFLALDARWQFGLDRVATTRMSHMASQTAMNQLLESINSDSLLTIDLSTPFFATDERALLQTNGSPLYFDGNHLSATGAVFAASAIEPTILALSAKAEP
jgi:lysophospholipase L1-like esterase